MMLRSPLVITLGGLCRFEIATGIAAPAFIETLVDAARDKPDDPLPDDVVQGVLGLLSSCLGGGRFATMRAHWILRRSPGAVSSAFAEFLTDPLPKSEGSAGGDSGGPAVLPSALDLRADWVASGAPLGVFDGLTLWEHSRIIASQQARQRAALADAAVAARVAQSKNDQFTRFINEMSPAKRSRTPAEWAQHVFQATANMPVITQKELAELKGSA